MGINVQVQRKEDTHFTVFPLDFCGEGEFGQGFNEEEGVQQEVDFYLEKFNVACVSAEVDEYGYAAKLVGTQEQLEKLVIHCWGEENLGELTVQTL